jgi:hypothetical protein
MDLRSGMDYALPDDGHRGMAGLETRRLAPLIMDLFRAARAQRRMDAYFLRLARARLGAGGDRLFMVRDFHHVACLLASQQTCRVPAIAISRLGFIRGFPQFHTLANESGLTKFADIPTPRTKRNPAKTEAHGGRYGFGFRRVVVSGGCRLGCLRGERMLAATGTTYLFSGRY